VMALVWVPILFLSTTRLLQTGRLAWLAATAPTMGALLLSGHPETQFLCAFIWALY
jgi:hypothetical protein